jgi:hypothetical protein
LQLDEGQEAIETLGLLEHAAGTDLEADRQPVKKVEDGGNDQLPAELEEVADAIGDPDFNTTERPAASRKIFDRHRHERLERVVWATAMLKASMEGDDVVADEQVFTGDAVDVDFIFGVFRVLPPEAAYCLGNESLPGRVQPAGASKFSGNRVLARW